RRDQDQALVRPLLGYNPQVCEQKPACCSRRGLGAGDPDAVQPWLLFSEIGIEGERGEHTLVALTAKGERCVHQAVAESMGDGRVVVLVFPIEGGVAVVLKEEKQVVTVDPVNGEPALS